MPTQRLHDPYVTGFCTPLVIGDRRKKVRFKRFSLSLGADDRQPRLYRSEARATRLALEFAAKSRRPCPVYGWAGVLIRRVATAYPDGRVKK